MNAAEIEQEARELDPRYEEQRIVGLLQVYDDARSTESTAKKAKDEAGKQIKDWLGKHPDEALYDGETGIEARLQERRGSDRYDVHRIPWKLVKRLWEANALNVDLDVLKSLADRDTLPVDIQPWRVPGGVTYALDVKRR